MKALTWHGRRDVRVETFPTRASSSRPTRSSGSRRPRSAAPTCTCTRCFGPFLDAGDILGHEPMGIVEEVGSEVTHIKPGDRVVIPFNISCGHCWMCDAASCSRSARRRRSSEQGKGASLFGYTKLYGQVPGGQAEYLRVPQAHFGPIKVPEGPPDEQFLFLSDVLPTAWQAVEYADVPRAARVAVLGLGPIGQMAARIAPAPRRRARHRRRPRARAAARWRAAHGIESLDLDDARRRRRGAARADRRSRARRGHRRGRHGGARLARSRPAGAEASSACCRTRSRRR